MRLFKKHDRVMLADPEGDYRRTPVFWICGVAYAKPYDDYIQLEAGGKLTSPGYFKRWRPATDSMIPLFERTVVPLFERTTE